MFHIAEKIIEFVIFPPPLGFSPRGFLVKSLDTATKGEYNIKNAVELFLGSKSQTERGEGKKT